MSKRILKFFIAIMIFSIVSSNLNVFAMTVNTDIEEWDSNDDNDDDDDAMELTKNCIRVVPGKKKIKKGKIFYIKTAPAFWSDLYDLSEEEWEEVCDCNIDSIFYRSTKPKIASVNKKTGKVTAHKKGSANIKTTICFRDGSEAVYKTKVYVTN